MTGLLLFAFLLLAGGISAVRLAVEYEKVGAFLARLERKKKMEPTMNDLKFENEALRTALRIAVDHTEQIHKAVEREGKEINPSYAARVATIRSFVSDFRLVNPQPGHPTKLAAMQRAEDEGTDFGEFMRGLYQ